MCVQYVRDVMHVQTVHIYIYMSPATFHVLLKEGCCIKRGLFFVHPSRLVRRVFIGKVATAVKSKDCQHQNHQSTAKAKNALEKKAHRAP